MPPTFDHANIARHLPAMAAQQPERAALKVPRGRTPEGGIDYLSLSFGELDGEVNAWCARLRAAGVRPGDRTLVMVRQGLPLIASVFSLFKLGAVPVVIDPGMGLKRFLACVTRSRPRVLLGIPAAQVVSRIFRGAFAGVEVRVTASGSLTARLGKEGVAVPETPVIASAPDALAAILFTSGSTGAPKGVCYEHGMFDAQVKLIRETYRIEPGEIDLPMLPIFALFNPALGMTTVVPEIDPRRPAAVDPAKIVRAIRQENVTNSFGSPTLWRKIGEYCVREKITLPSLRRVLCAGAPVPAALWKSSATWMPDGRLHSPYGATEALPASTVSADEIGRVSGPGACVGRPVDGVDVKIIALADGPIGTMAEVRELPEGEIGEIIVHGPVVTKTYDAAPKETAAAKIGGAMSPTERQAPPSPPESSNPGIPERSDIWHRMGDCGYRDREGRLWFCGRKVERVETAAGTFYTEPCEQVFRQHPRVGRCALIGVGPSGRQVPAIVVEAKRSMSSASQTFANELRSLARADARTASISRFYFHPRFPVDVRHNAKIHRLTLARWAATARGFEGTAP